MVNGARGIRGVVRKIAIRIGEGLVIGLGVAMALGGYNAVVNATDQLEAARERFQTQETINERLSTIAGDSKRTDERLKSEITEINRSLKNIVGRIEQIEGVLAKIKPGGLPNSTGWTDLKERTQGRVYMVPDTQSEFAPAIERYDSLENLDELIKEQKQIK